MVAGWCNKYDYNSSFNKPYGVKNQSRTKGCEMSGIKCPFCQQELHKDSDGYYTCYTDNCGCMKYGGNGATGSESLWLALIRTRKALEIAKNRLSCIKNNYHHWTPDRDAQMIAQASNGLDEINAMDKSK